MSNEFVYFNLAKKISGKGERSLQCNEIVWSGFHHIIAFFLKLRKNDEKKSKNVTWAYSIFKQRYAVILKYAVANYQKQKFDARYKVSLLISNVHPL